MLVRHILSVLFMATTVSARISGVSIATLSQDHLDLLLKVLWEDKANNDTTVDVWLTTRQEHASTWQDIVILEDAPNNHKAEIDVGDTWSSTGFWDSSESGEALVCVYDSSDYSNNGCSPPKFLAATDEPDAEEKMYIGEVDVVTLDQVGMNISFEVMWDTEAVEGASAGFVDIWFITEQVEPPRAWRTSLVKQAAKNTGVAEVDAYDHWALSNAGSTGGSWDEARPGKGTVCLYDIANYEINSCSASFTLAPGVEEMVVVGGEESEEGGSDESSVGEEMVPSSDSSSGSSSKMGIVAVLYVTGTIAFIVLASWMVIGARRRQQRNALLGRPNEAQELPYLSHQYSRF